MGLVKLLIERIRHRLVRPQFRRTLLVQSMSDVPEQLDSDVVVLIGFDRPKWAIFGCPCRTGHRVELNLQPAFYPFWRVSSRKGRITLWPSVDVRNNRRCHYFVTDGFVRRVAVE